MTCIAACILTFLRLLGCPRDKAALVLIPLVWFYTVATGWQSSAVRSAFMGSFVFAGWAIRRPTNLLNSTAAAGLLILLAEPEQLFQASFQLSFFVVSSIALILDNKIMLGGMDAAVDQLLRYDPLLPVELRPAWKRVCEIPLRFAAANVAISAASWLGSMPLTAYYFNLVTPVSLAANLIAVPLSSFSLACTLGTLLLSPLAPLFNLLSWAGMAATIAVTRWFAEFEWGYFYVPKPNLAFFVLYLWTGAMLIVAPLRTRLTKLVWPLTAVFLGVFAASVFHSGRAAHLTVLQAPGNPVFCDQKGRSDDVLINCSNAGSAPHLVSRFLRGNGVGKVPQLVLTQGTADHIGGFRTIERDFAPDTIYASLIRGRSRVYRDVLASLEESQKIRKIERGSTIGSWTVLLPLPERRAPRAQDNAVSLKGEVNGWRIIYLPAIGKTAQADLMNTADDLRTDILLANESSTGESIRSDLLARFKPMLIVHAAAERPFASRFRRDLAELYAGSPATVISTLAEGSVALELRFSECVVRTAQGREFSLIKKR